MLSWSINVFSHLGVFLISVKPLTTENTENKTTPKICKITVVSWFEGPGPQRTIVKVFETFTRGSL